MTTRLRFNALDRAAQRVQLNCLISIVMAVAKLTPGGAMIEVLAPIALAPLIFVYGELFPKSLFYQRP